MVNTNIVSKEFGKRSNSYENAKWVIDKSFINHIANFADIKEYENTLEIGIGSGALAEKMKLYTKNLIGVDVSKSMLEKAQRYIPPHQLLCYDATLLSSLFLNETFDFVYLRSVLHHLDIYKLFKEVHKILIINGIFLIVETVALNEKDEKFQLEFINSLHEGHTEFPAMKSLCSILKKVNFSIKKQEIWKERSSLQNILSSTAKTTQEKEKIFSLLKNAPNKIKIDWEIQIEENDINFTRNWGLILAHKMGNKN
ncbi:MAG: methyltransferase domain-containing protein [Thermoplasmata archaeon]|nr:MAG: methyltransferase domain-containing protein [Thermoplasmata archaeon]